MIAVDAMGGDFGLQVTVPAVIKCLERHSDLHILLVGDKPSMEAKLGASKEKYADRLSLVHTTEVVGMGEPPAKALRFKKDSSMRVAINLVKEGTAAACVSAGNTGALMATAKFVLRTIPGIARPAIISRMPNLNENGSSFMLDLGANLDCTGEHLFQFAVMGAVLASSVHGMKHPKVGLINVGEEQIKGNAPVKEANQLLMETPEINYVGFVEGNDIYSGRIDVVVCDGFIGNVALKASEGLMRSVYTILNRELRRNFVTKFVGLLIKWTLKSVIKKIDPKSYNGASLVGLNGIVIKSHGAAGVDAFATAVSLALQEVELNVPSQILHQVSALVRDRENKSSDADPKDSSLSNE